jgi:hypothetical protein
LIKYIYYFQNLIRIIIGNNNSRLLNNLKRMNSLLVEQSLKDKLTSKLYKTKIFYKCQPKEPLPKARRTNISLMMNLNLLRMFYPINNKFSSSKISILMEMSTCNNSVNYWQWIKTLLLSSSIKNSLNSRIEVVSCNSSNNNKWTNKCYNKLWLWVLCLRTWIHFKAKSRSNKWCTKLWFKMHLPVVRTL